MPQQQKGARTHQFTASGHEYVHNNEFVYLRSTVIEHAELTVEVKRRAVLANNCFRKYSKELYGNPSVSLEIKLGCLSYSLPGT